MTSRRRSNTGVVVSVLGILIGTVTTCLCLMIFGIEEYTDQGEIEYNSGTVVDEGSYQYSGTTVDLPEKIDFQPVVDEWASSIGGNKGVAIYDLDRDEMVGAYNIDEEFPTASLYKLFVVYEGYRRVESEEWLANDNVGATGYTILECLDLAIRESNSTCAEVLQDIIDPDILDQIIEQDYGINHSDISQMLSTPEDIAKMMQVFYKHSDIKSEALISQIKDSFLVQPTTEYNWRQGLPSGFSDSVNVYNKVGWDYNPRGGFWNIYNDAAIVEFPNEGRNFVVVVMTNGVPFQQIRKFGTMLEEAFYNNI